MLTGAQKLYLYAIYKLGQEGKSIRSAEVAKIVGVSKPSTVRMTQKLIDDGYIIKEPYHEIALTEKGVRAANELYTPCVIMHDFLKNTIGVSEESADVDAIVLASQLTEETCSKLTEYVLNKYTTRE